MNKHGFTIPTPKLRAADDARLDLQFPVSQPLNRAVDRSGWGNNGQPYGTPMAEPGVFGRAIRFHSAGAGGGGGGLNCGSNASLDIAAPPVTIATWIKVSPVGAAAAYFFAKSDFATGGWLITHAAARQIGIYPDVGTPAILVWTTNAFSYMFHHYAATIDASSMLRIYVDGLQDVTRAVTPFTDIAAQNVYVGTSLAGYTIDGSLDHPFICATALSPEQIYREWLAGANKPIYYDTFEDYPIDIVNKTAGALCGPVRVLTGEDKIVVDTLLKKWLESQVAGNVVMQYPGDIYNNAYGTWEFDFRKESAGQEVICFMATANAAYNDAAQNAYCLVLTALNDLEVWRISGGAFVSACCFTAAGYIANNTTYRFRVTRRLGGQFTFYIKGGVFVDWTLMSSIGGVGTNPTVNNFVLTGGFFSASLVPSSKISGLTKLHGCVRPDSFPWEFLSGTWYGSVSGTDILKECDTAGVTYLPKDLDWQTCEFKHRVGFGWSRHGMFSELGIYSAAGQNGYCITLPNNGTAGAFDRIDAGFVGASYAGLVNIAAMTLYEWKVTRTAAGRWRIYVRGGAYTNWTLWLDQVDATYGSMNYWIEHISSGGQNTAPKYYAELRLP